MRCNAYIDPETGIALQGEKLKEAQWSNTVVPRCAHELSDADVFCPVCGARVERAALVQSDTVDLLKGTEQDVGTKELGKAVAIGCSVGVFVIFVAVIAGIMIWSVFLSNTFWLCVLLCALLAGVGCCAESMVSVYEVAFMNRGEDMSSKKRGLLRWVCIYMLCVPLSPTAYGFIQGGIESLQCIDKGKINLAKYFSNKSEMNLFTRVGYRWIYHIFWDFGSTEDEILETSPRGLWKFYDADESASTPVNADKGHSYEEILREFDDSTLSMKISTAMLKDDFAEARRLAKQISDKDLRDFQSALIDNAESLDENQKELQKALKEFQDILKQ